MTSIERAAAVVAGPSVAQAGPDWFLIVDLIRDIVRALISGCLPTPQEAYAYLTHEPNWVERLFGFNRRREARIRELVEQHWGGSSDMLPMLKERVIAACKFQASFPLLQGMYEEAKS